ATRRYVAHARAAHREERALAPGEPRRTLSYRLPVRGHRVRRAHRDPLGRGRARGAGTMELTATDMELWLGEDVGAGDVTTAALVDEDALCEARIVVREPGVVCGLEPAAAVFAALRVRLEPLASDGDGVELGLIGLAGRGRLRHARAGRRGARRGRRSDSARQHEPGRAPGIRHARRRQRGARGLGRRHARHRPPDRRDRRRLHLRRGADALRTLSRRLTGGSMTTLELTRMQDEVKALARERGAVILAHNYQVPEVQDVADYVGDSLGLSREAAATDAEAIVFCGVHFMAETAAILSPDKTVLIPDPDAGCSLAASITADQLRAWKAEHPGAVVVSYVNTTAEVKAET